MITEEERGLYRRMIPRPELVGEALVRAWTEAKLKDERLTYKNFAELMGLPLEILLRRLHVAQSEKLAQAKEYTLGEAMELAGDAMVVGDVHVPFTDWGLAAMVVPTAKKLFPRKKERRLIIGGDYFNFDAFSHYPTLVLGPNWEEEKIHGRLLMEEWMREFSEIYLILGNHDRRPIKESEGQLTSSDILDWLGIPARLRISGFGYCVLNSGGEKWRITHPKGYSQIPLRTVNRIALKEQMHVMGFHEHLFGITWDEFGRYVICNGGCLVDPMKLGYVKLDDTTRPTMKQGFCAIKGGTPYLFGQRPFTDWSVWTKNG